MSFPSRVSAGFAGLFVGAVACSGAFSGTELDGGAEAGPPVPSTTVPPPGPEADSALPDAPAEAAAEGGACVVLTLDPTSKLGPVLSGRARVEGGTLTLLPGDPFAFNQSGTAVFSFPPSTKVKGAFAVVVGRPPSSGYGGGAALAFYPSAPGAPSRGLFGLAAGPAVGVFLESYRASMSATKRDQATAGDFTTVRPTSRLFGLDDPPFRSEVSFVLELGRLTLSVGGAVTTAHRSFSALAFGAACTLENPQGFAITDFSATACP
ncbi:MAG: hypothetical protein U0183_33580 [Polyangiaceae bacterium]